MLFLKEFKKGDFLNKTVIKTFCFIFILFGLLKLAGNILCSSAGSAWATQTGMKDVHRYKNQYDVLFLGTSTVISNISNQELFEKYGITGISLGEPEQLVYLTKYTLEEALKYQKPSVVFFDTKAMFYSEDEIIEKTINHKEYIHNIVDSFRSFEIKNSALERIKMYNNAVDVWEFYSRLYYGHGNWENISSKNFKSYSMQDCMNGNIALYNSFEEIDYEYEDNVGSSLPEISASNEQAFAEMIEICNAADVDFVMITGYLSTKSQHDMMVELSEKYGVTYIDINEALSQVSLDFNLDFHDGVHFNLSGAIKWTDYLGAFLEENYELLDKRTMNEYTHLIDQSEVFNEQKNLINTKLNLLSSITFDEYIKELQNIDMLSNIIFVSVYDDASAALTEEEIELLNKLKLERDLRNHWRANYVAVLSDQAVIEQFSEERAVMLSGKADGISYELASGGYYEMETAYIKINGKDYMQKGRGINIVVFNKKLGQVISSVYFDTSLNFNPPAGRIIFAQVEKNQFEVKKNIWINQD